MNYTPEGIKHITDKITPLVKSWEFVGRMALCGSSDHDVDILVEIDSPPDLATKDDTDIYDYVVTELLKIVKAVGEMIPGNHGVGFRDSGVMEWLSYESKIANQKIVTHINFMTEDGVPIDLFWTMGKTALESVNHDYFADKVLWRIEGGCP